MTTTPTRPAHLAMFSIAAHGHVNPSLEVVRELAARGHRVSYAIPPRFAEVVAGTGAEPKVYRSTLPGPDAEPLSWGIELIDYAERFFAEAVQAVPQLAELYEGEVPDLVLSDTACYASRVLAHRWGVPHIQLAPHMVAWEGYDEEAGERILASLKSSERGIAYYGHFRDWLAAEGIEMHPDDFMGHPDRSLVLIPKALQPHADRVDETVHTFVGPCLGDRAHQGDWERPAGAERILLVSLASALTGEPDLYRECVAAFGDLPGWHVVLQTGEHVDAAELGAVPENIEVHDRVPQLAVLEQADVFLTHASMGGSQEGLATGTPMIAVPQGADQPGNAATLESLGVARHIPKEEATAGTLREALRSVADDPVMRDRCRELQASVAREGGTRRAADLIEAEVRAVVGGAA